MMKPLRIFGIVCCIAFSSVMFASAENATDELQMQIYDLDGEPDLTKKAPKPTPRKTAPRPEADKFVPAQPPPPPPQPRYDAPPPPPPSRPAPAPVPSGEDSHFIQADDYFIQKHGMEGHTWIYVDLAKMVTAPGAHTKGEAEFMKVRDAKNYWTSHFWQTRIASQSELRLGLQVIIFEGNHRGSIYNAPQSKDRARGSSWFMAKITDMSDMYKGYVTVSGNYKVGLGNLRILMH